MLYQWGRKDPFTFATNSEQWGGISNERGKHPVKIYTIDGVLIYQNNIGESNTDKQPTGGIIIPSISATSMLETIKTPNTYYGNSVIISQLEHTRYLWDYYWTSYSRGTDGKDVPFPKNWHNNYLDSYTLKRFKSIYDPCPFGFRIPSNGTYNQFTNSGWISGSYVGGTCWNLDNLGVSWFISSGWRSISGTLDKLRSWMWYFSSTPSSSFASYILDATAWQSVVTNQTSYPNIYGRSVRCIVFLCCKNARQSAPTDGRDPFGNGGFYTSKQNSDANGMLYQWGRKDPFTFATNSEKWKDPSGDCGKYSVKIYTIDGVLIYQESNGSSNKDKQPLGGIILSSNLAISIMETIKKPTIFYGVNGAIINRVGQTNNLWNYYWTSYSRGTDGRIDNNYAQPNWHNNYLDGYTSQRLKSIYDPCPHGFRVPSNGSWNQLNSKQTWILGSYLGGISWNLDGNLSWFFSGRRYWQKGEFSEVGTSAFYRTATIVGNETAYALLFNYSGVTYGNRSEYGFSTAFSVRCIDLFLL